MDLLDVSCTLAKQPEEMNGRDLAILAFLEAAHLHAVQIANSPDPNERRRLLFIAREVAQMNPEFAHALLDAAKIAVGEAPAHP